jgi:hypothetical protein
MLFLSVSYASVVRVASLTLFTTLSSNANSINELCVLIIVFLFNDFTSEFLSLIFFSLSVSSCAICFFLLPKASSLLFSPEFSSLLASSLFRSSTFSILASRISFFSLNLASVSHNHHRCISLLSTSILKCFGLSLKRSL